MLDAADLPSGLVACLLYEEQAYFAHAENVYTISLHELRIQKPLSEWLAHTSFIFHDIKEALRHLQNYSLSCAETCQDLHLAAFLIDSRQSTGLAGLLEQYTDQNWHADTKVLAAKPEEERHSLLAAICKTYIQMHAKLQNMLQELDLISLYQDIELPLAYLLYRMELQGVMVNRCVLEDISQKTTERIELLKEQIFTYALREFNLNSPKQLAEVLFDEMGMPSNRKRSTAVDILEQLVQIHPIASLLLEYRKYQKLLSTYAEGLQKYIQEDGKIHTRLHQCQTQTGRLSSSDPNLQNISIRNEEAKEIRKAFVPSKPSQVLLAADYSQVELRMLAHLCDSKELISAFQEKQDIHLMTAMRVFHVEKEQVSALMRRQAKAINFGIVYGISDFGLAQQMDVSRKEAEQFILRYFAAYPTIQSYMESIVSDCEQNGYVTTILKRRRYISDIHDRNFMVREAAKRAAMNAPIQGSAADLIKVAMLYIDAAMKQQKLASKMILQVHDELIFEVEVAEVDIMRTLIQRGMEDAMRLHVPLVAEVAQGANWLEAK